MKTLDTKNDTLVYYCVFTADFSLRPVWYLCIFVMFVCFLPSRRVCVCDFFFYCVCVLPLEFKTCDHFLCYLGYLMNASLNFNMCLPNACPGLKVILPMLSYQLLVYSYII